MTYSREDAEARSLHEAYDELRRQLAERTLELDEVQQRLIQSEKLTAIGQLVQGLAHDMNSPLSIVITNLSVLGRHAKNLGAIALAADALLPELADASKPALEAALQGADLAYTLADLPDLLEETTIAARRVADLVDSLAMFARRDTGKPALVEMRDVLEAALELAANPLGRFAHVVRAYAATPPVFGSSSQLTELFVRVLLNAAQALEGQPGTVTISTSFEVNSVVVRVRDTGSGIAPDDLGRVFDPLFTSHAAAGCVGMGLAVCSGIVARHGGSIVLDSALGAGTTVTVSLPGAESGLVAA